MFPALGSAVISLSVSIRAHRAQKQGAQPQLTYILMKFSYGSEIEGSALCSQWPCTQNLMKSLTQTANSIHTQCTRIHSPPSREHVYYITSDWIHWLSLSVENTTYIDVLSLYSTTLRGCNVLMGIKLKWMFSMRFAHNLHDWSAFIVSLPYERYNQGLTI